MRGRKPTPTQLKLLRGNPGCRRINRHEARPRAKPPTPPARLEPAALEYWRALAPKLFRIGLLTEIDGEALAVLCDTLADHERARAEMKHSGLVFTTKQGQSYPSPFYTVATRSAAVARSLFAEFGLTPSARSRIEVTAPLEGDARDDFELFLAKGRKA